MSDADALRAYRTWADELAEHAIEDEEARPSYEELAVRVRHLVDVVQEQALYLENYRTCGHLNDYHVMAARLRELSTLLNRSATEREHALARELKAANDRHARAENRRIAHGNSVITKDRQLARMRWLYRLLSDRAEMPWPPCAHGEDPRRCIDCVAAWLGREGVIPDARTRDGNPPVRKQQNRPVPRKPCELCGTVSEGFFCSNACRDEWERRQ